MLLVACLCTHATAQTVASPPTVSQLERERARIAVERKGMFDTNNPATRAKQPGVPSDAAVAQEMQRVEPQRKALFDRNNPAAKDAPNAFPNVPTPARSDVDVEMVARRYEQKVVARRADGLMVFASFSMPEASLKKLLADTARAGGVVVLRGFKDGSMKRTALAVSDLGASAGVQISPDAFTKYRVAAVPAVVLVMPESGEVLDGEGCALPDTYAMVSGDVGLGYALAEIERRSPEFQQIAARYARPLRGGTQ